MDHVLFASYLLSLSAITINLVRAKLQDDFENDLKDLREYDLSYEKIKVGVDSLDPDGKFIVLVNHKGKKTSGEEGEKAAPLFAHTIPYANILDPVRYFQVSIKAISSYSFFIRLS